MERKKRNTYCERNVQRWEMGREVTSRHVRSGHVNSRHVLRSCHVTSGQFMSRHLTSGHLTSRQVTSRQATSRHVRSHHVRSRHVRSASARGERSQLLIGRVTCTHAPVSHFVFVIVPTATTRTLLCDRLTARNRHGRRRLSGRLT